MYLIIHLYYLILMPICPCPLKPCLRLDMTMTIGLNIFWFLTEFFTFVLLTTEIANLQFRSTVLISCKINYSSCAFLPSHPSFSPIFLNKTFSFIRSQYQTICLSTKGCFKLQNVKVFFELSFICNFTFITWWAVMKMPHRQNS